MQLIEGQMSFFLFIKKRRQIDKTLADVLTQYTLCDSRLCACTLCMCAQKTAYQKLKQGFKMHTNGKHDDEELQCHLNMTGVEMTNKNKHVLFIVPRVLEHEF